MTLSLLIDRAGFVRGYRIITDPRAEAELRKDAHMNAIAFKSRFGPDGWKCSDMPSGPAAPSLPLVPLLRYKTP